MGKIRPGLQSFKYMVNGFKAMAKYRCSVCGEIYDEEKEGSDSKTFPMIGCAPSVIDPRTNTI